MVGGQAVHDVVGMEQCFLHEPSNVVVVSQVEDPGALTARAHQAAETQLCEMLGDRCRPGADVLGELVDRVLPVEEGPHDPQAGRVSDHREHLDGPIDLIVGRVLNFLRIHADKSTIASRVVAVLAPQRAVTVITGDPTDVANVLQPHAVTVVML